jgi:hypothetical protein
MYSFNRKACTIQFVNASNFISGKIFNIITLIKIKEKDIPL